MRLGSQEIQYLNAFQAIVRADAKDCLVGPNTISFLVKEGQMGLTIGRDGINVKNLRKALKKNIELFEYKPTADAFVSSAFRDVVFAGFETENAEGKTILVAKINGENRRKMLNDFGKMKRIKELAKRNYNIDDIKIGK